MDLNLVERAIATMAPQWGLKRLGAKVGLEQARSAARAYDAARRDRRTDGWRASAGSANAELSPSLKLIISRSRDMCRNNEWSVNARRKWPAYLVGSGIVPRPDVEGKAKQTARDAWNSFCDNCDPEGLTDFYGIQARVMGEAFEGGAAFLRWYPRPPELGLKVPLQCEVLEHDFLDTQKTEILDAGKGNIVIHGVEYDSFGRRVAFWLFPTHPGELAIIRGNMSFRSERVSSEFCDHIFRVDRPGQVTGVPWLAPTMLRMRDTADYEEAELVRKKIEACFTVFVRRGGPGTQGLAQAVDQNTDTKGRRLEKIAPGLIAYTDSDGEITTAAPTPSTDGGHMERQQYAFAAGVGLTFAQATGNLTKVNFSSMREGKLDHWAVMDQLQWHMIVPQICRPSWKRVMRAAAGRGLQVSPDTPAKHAMPKRPWVNPVDDLKAAAGELALGLESWAEMVASRGYDPQELLDEIQQWLPKLKEAGISVGATPGLAGITGGPNDKQPAAKPADVTSTEDANVD